MRSKDSNNLVSRRGFIRQAACAAVGTVAMTSTIRDLRFMNAALAQSNITDYKALVCIFLAGGNDSNNLIIPTLPTEYDNYAAVRSPVLAIPQSGILPITARVSDGHTYGFHPACPQLQNLFSQGKLATIFNVGTLVHPLTRAQYQSTLYKKPPQLFSHADQVTQWQTSVPDQPPLTGWGGRCADLLNAVQPDAPISMSITLAGANTFEVGNIVSQYSVKTSGAISLSGVTGTRLQALSNILGQSYANLQEQAYAKVAEHSIATSSLLNNAIAATADPYWTVPFPTSITTPTSGTVFTSALSPQLKMIARLIEAGYRARNNGGFGMKRQIFFCQIGGFDLHTNQATAGAPSNGSHANLLADLSQSLYAFQMAIEQLQLGNSVTAFTASDFGRTFPCNGQGSDHGWGSHHLVLGGAVSGQQTYGRFPVQIVGGPDDTSTGRWIPSTATDQYYATLATWFGVDPGNMDTIFPNIGRFPSLDLGFMS